jgi:hypothetical protein
MFEINSRHLSKQLVGPILFVGLVLLSASSMCLGQVPPPDTPDYIPAVILSDILNGLKDQSIKSMFDRNRELIKAVDERDVGFELNANTEPVLTKAGASDGLLWSISRGQKNRSHEIMRLLKLYETDHGSTDIEGRRKRIAVAKELLDRIGDPDTLVGEERGFRVLVEYFKDVLPKMEASLERQLKSQRDH